MNTIISESVFHFLRELKLNNHKDWMDAHRSQYKTNEKLLKTFYNEVLVELNKTDRIEKLKVFRINRDIRFSKDKTPYNVHRSVSFKRAGAHRRGGYYLRIEPGKSAMAGGFFSPEAKDLHRIRTEFEMDSKPIRQILTDSKFNKAFGGFNQEYKVKTAPKGFSKEDSNIDLIRLKSYFVVHTFTDDEVMATDFKDNLMHHYELLRPFFDYMSDVLTTDLNGVSLLD